MGFLDRDAVGLLDPELTGEIDDGHPVPAGVLVGELDLHSVVVLAVRHSAEHSVVHCLGLQQNRD